MIEGIYHAPNISRRVFLVFLIRESSHSTHEVVIIIPCHNNSFSSWSSFAINCLKIAMIMLSLNLECTIFQVNPKKIRTQKEFLMLFALHLVNIVGSRLAHHDLDNLKGNKCFNWEKLKYCTS